MAYYTFSSSFNTYRCRTLFYFCLFLDFDRKTKAAFILVTTLGNTSFIGFPFVSYFFGNDQLIWAIFFDQFGSFLGFVIFGTIVAAYAAGKEVSLGYITKTIVTFPPFAGIVAALILRNLSFDLTLFKFIGDSLLFLILLAVGMKFSLSDVKKNIKLASLVLISKMFLVPLFIYLIIAFFFSFEVPYQIAFIESAMPPMVMASILAIEYNLRSDLAVSAVGLGLLLSFLLIPFYYYFLFLRSFYVIL